MSGAGSTRIPWILRGVGPQQELQRTEVNAKEDCWAGEKVPGTGHLTSGAEKIAEKTACGLIKKNAATKKLHTSRPGGWSEGRSCEERTSERKDESKGVKLPKSRGQEIVTRSWIVLQ